MAGKGTAIRSRDRARVNKQKREDVRRAKERLAGETETPEASDPKGKDARTNARELLI